MCPNNPIFNFLCQVITLRGSFHWSFVFSNVFNPYIIKGLWITIALSVLAQLVGTIIGLLLYLLRRSRVAPLRLLANGYIWIFRGTPLILQVTIFFYLSSYTGFFRLTNAINFFPSIGYGQVPLDGFLAAIAALSLNEGAYMAEIVRAGIDSIDVGQMEASKSLGMTYLMAMRRVVLPQAARVIVPPLGNEFNSMLKSSSLAYVASVGELYFQVTLLGGQISRTLEYSIVVAIWYLTLTTVWGLIQAWIERQLNLSSIEPGTPSGGFMARVFGVGGRERPAPGVAVEPVAGVLGDNRR